MKVQEFLRAGHWPTLLAAFLYFDISFMVWTVLGPLASYLTAELQLPIAEKFGLVALPILAGAILRVPMGILADRIGPKRAGQVGQLIVMGGLLWAWLFGLHAKWQVEVLGIILGFGGASFAVALTQASRWYPPHYQGIALGIAGAGNMGVVLDALLVPWFAEHYGWQAVFGFLLIPVVVVFVLYTLMAKDAPMSTAPVSLAHYKMVLKDHDSWWFMFFYFITFGGFVGLGSALPLYFTTWHHASGVAAGLMAALVVLAGSVFRPIGGWVADRVGGIRTLQVLFVVVACTYGAISFIPESVAPLVVDTTMKVTGWSFADLPLNAWVTVVIFFICAIALGMGNGAVFQLVPQRFRREIGVMTGIIGMAGGLGGFFLAKTMGWSQGMTGDFAASFWLFTSLAVLGWLGLWRVKSRWRTTWGAVSGARI